MNMKTNKIPLRIRRNFPQVTKVRDATESITISVATADSHTGKRKNPEQCALAHACKRQKIADGALIGIGVSWLVKGDTATRYFTSNGVSREITSFDRHHDFASGKDYVLSKVSPSGRLNKDQHRGGKHLKQHAQQQLHRHRTADIRKVA